MTRRMMLAPLVAGLVALLAAPATADEPARGGMWIEQVLFSGGDGDDVPEPGERLQVTISVRNGGPDELRDITGTIKALGDTVTVIQDTASWPDLAVEEAGENTRAFVIEISPDAPRQSPTCEGMPAPDGDVPVSSDGSGTTVHGEPIVVEPEPGDGSDGSGGSAGSEPGSDGEVDEPAAPPVEPAEEKPDDAGYSEPGGATDEELEAERGEPEDFDPPARVELKLLIDSSAGEQELYADNGIVCAMLESGGVPLPAEDDGTLDAAPIAARGGEAPASRTPAIVSAIVLLGAMASLLAWLKLKGPATAA